MIVAYFNYQLPLQCINWSLFWLIGWLCMIDWLQEPEACDREAWLCRRVGDHQAAGAHGAQVGAVSQLFSHSVIYTFIHAFFYYLESWINHLNNRERCRYVECSPLNSCFWYSSDDSDSVMIHSLVILQNVIFLELVVIFYSSFLMHDGGWIYFILPFYFLNLSINQCNGTYYLTVSNRFDKLNRSLNCFLVLPTL